MADYIGTSEGDRLVGTNQDDYIQGQGGDDILIGRGGNDLLRGDNGNDELQGGDGNDILVGGAGEDLLLGGAGNDTIDSIDRPQGLFDPPVPAQQDRIDAGVGDDDVTAGHYDLIDGGEGTDNLSINFNFQSVGAVNINVLGALGSVSDGTTFNNFEFVNFNLTDDGDDVSNTGDIRANISGGDGNDAITTGASDDVLSGGSGNDVLKAGAGNDLIYGGSGNDVIFGGAGDDATTVDRESNGRDRTDLGGGSDEVRVEGTTGQVRLTFTSAEVGNGSANDSNSMANQDGKLAVRFQAEDANGNLVGDISRFDDEGITFIAGTQGITFDVRDLVAGTQRGDFFEGVVLGTSGDDDLSFFPPFRESQSFYYNAGGGNDTVTAGSGKDFLVGGGGNDVLNAGAGDDTMLGGLGNDSLYGGFGRDILNGGGGDDLLDGGENTDTVDYAQATAGVTLDLAISGAQNTGGGGVDTLVSIENARGSAFGDVLVGNLGRNVITDSLGGADQIFGGGGDDVLTITRSVVAPAQTLVLDGNNGNDRLSFDGTGGYSQTVALSGGFGDDTITANGALQVNVDAGAGDDTVRMDTMGGVWQVNLGEGSDTLFLLSTDGEFRDSGKNRVTDFETGAGGDVIDLSAYLSNGALKFYAEGSDPFADGHMRFIQSGNRTLLQVDRNGGGDSYRTLLTFANTDADSFTQDNLAGFTPASNAAAAPAHASSMMHQDVMTDYVLTDHWM